MNISGLCDEVKKGMVMRNHHFYSHEMLKIINLRLQIYWISFKLLKLNIVAIRKTYWQESL